MQCPYPTSLELSLKICWILEQNNGQILDTYLAFLVVFKLWVKCLQILLKGYQSFRVTTLYSIMTNTSQQLFHVQTTVSTFNGFTNYYFIYKTHLARKKLRIYNSIDTNTCANLNVRSLPTFPILTVFSTYTVCCRQTNSNFGTVLAQLEREPECQSLALYSFLMLPMQRITRLRLLIETMLTLLDQDDSEYICCQKALDVLNKVSLCLR